MCFIRYTSINVPYKDYKIDSIPVGLNQTFETEEFRITYISTSKKTILKKDEDYVHYLIGVKMENKTNKVLKYPVSKLKILASNYNYNQSFSFYNQEKEPTSFDLKPNEQKEGFLSYTMPYDWNITKDSPVQLVYFESVKNENKTKEYKLSF